MLMQPITQYDSRVAQMFRNLRGLGIQSILPAAFVTHRRWYLADGSIVDPSSEIVDGDDHYLRTRNLPIPATANRLQISHGGQQFAGVGIRIRPTFTADFDSDLSDHGLASAGGPVAPTRNLNTANVTDPRGGNTATELIFPDVLGAGEVSTAFVIPGVDQTIGQAIWLRGASGGETVYLAINDGGVNFGAVTECILTTSWQRFAVGQTLRNIITIGVDLRDPGQAAQSAQTIYTWGSCIQNEHAFGIGTVDGDNPIIVTGDNLQWPNTGEQLIPAAEGTIIVIAVPEFDATDLVNDAHVLDLQVSGFASGLRLFAEAPSDQWKFIVRDAGANQAALQGTTPPAKGVPHVIVVTWKLNDFRLRINGVEEDSSVSGNDPSSVNAVARLGQGIPGNERFAGILGPILTFERALTLRQSNSVIHREIAPIYPGRLRMKA